MVRENLIVGLDIGTTKVCAIIGEARGEEQIEITGLGVRPSSGLKKGVIVNIEATIESIRSAVKEAELVAGVDVESVYVGIAGSHIEGANSPGVVTIKNGEVKKPDVKRVLDMAQTLHMPADRKVIHVLPQEFVIDDQDGIKDPLGISGIRLEGKAHIITGSSTAIDNVYKCVERAGLKVKEIVLEPLASGEATLTPDEKELGVLLVDIGGGTTDMVLLTSGSIKHTAVIGLGGNDITRDVAIVMRTPITEAERLKKHYGCACSSLVRENESVEVPSIGGRESQRVSCKLLSEIVEARAKEIFRPVSKMIRDSGYKDLLASGVVITGGSSLLDGMPECAEKIIELPVRRGVPRGIKGLVDMVSNPMYATGVGLVLYGFKKGGRAQPNGGEGTSLFAGIKNVANRLRMFF